VTVIASNVSSLPEVVGGAGVLVDPHDVDALSAKMRELQADDHLIERMGTAGRLRSQQFTWRKCAEETRQVYKAALA
jgi:glycosyltransferase involved in cell wall biosynthesis